MTKVGRFLRGCLVVDISAVGFVELLKTLKTQRQKSPTVPVQVWFSLANTFLWFDFQTYGFTYQGRNASYVAMFSCFKKSEKFLQREVYLLALIAETRSYICHKNMKSMGFFFTVFRKFSGKNV